MDKFIGFGGQEFLLKSRREILSKNNVDIEIDYDYLEDEEGLTWTNDAIDESNLERFRIKYKEYMLKEAEQSGRKANYYDRYNMTRIENLESVKKAVDDYRAAITEL